MRTRRESITDASTKLSAKLDSEIDTDILLFILGPVLLSPQSTEENIKTE